MSNYWNNYYKTQSENSAPTIPSQFCVFIANEFSNLKPTIIEFGCGNGRDAFFFGNSDFNVIAMDSSEDGINICKQVGHEKINFVAAEISAKNLKDSIIELSGNSSSRLLYSRFFLHAINESQEIDFLDLASKVCKENDHFALEFRTNKDEALSKITPKHYRRYINPLEFISKVQKNGFDVVYFLEGFGFAKYKSDDAHVARIILKRKE